MFDWFRLKVLGKLTFLKIQRISSLFRNSTFLILWLHFTYILHSVESLEEGCLSWNILYIGVNAGGGNIRHAKTHFSAFLCFVCRQLRNVENPCSKEYLPLSFCVEEKESFPFFVSSLGLVIELLAIRCRFSTIHSPTRLIFWQPTNYAEHQFDGGQIQFRSQTCKMNRSSWKYQIW